MIQIFYGDGKGKTSILNGAALRSEGAGLKTAIYRFLKGRETAENITLAKANIFVKHFHHGEKFVIQMNAQEKEETKKVLVEGMEEVVANQNKYEVIILDELLDLAASTVGILTEDEILAFILKLEGKELFISGHTVLPKVFEAADLITKLSAEKHYYNKGVKARKGIEF